MADTQDKENNTTDPAVPNKGGDEGPNKNPKGDDVDVVKFEPEEEAVSAKQSSFLLMMML